MAGSELASSEFFIEDQAFSPSYDLDLIPPPPHPFPKLLSRQQVVALSQSFCVSPAKVNGERWEGVEEESNHTTVRKFGPL